MRTNSVLSALTALCVGFLLVAATASDGSANRGGKNQAKKSPSAMVKLTQRQQADLAFDTKRLGQEHGPSKRRLKGGFFAGPGIKTLGAAEMTKADVDALRDIAMRAIDALTPGIIETGLNSLIGSPDAGAHQYAKRIVEVLDAAERGRAR